ncbi:MAG TPA: DUF6259 domain-containing protein, partial [Terriglobales bacterium]|nr:DUF6259 domain-containing protein [Terriglobales bacterium]
SYWNIEVDGLGSNPLASVNYPHITGIGPLGQSGDDDVLLLPTHRGALFHNPTTNFASGLGSAYPGGLQSMQLLSYFDQTSGFYFASDDTQGNKKGFFWGKTSSPAGDFSITIANNLNGLPADTVTVPYNLIVGVTQGDWSAAADLYRTWAVQQTWTQQSRTKTVPAWLRGIALSQWECTHGCQGTGQPEQSYASALLSMQQSEKGFNVSTMEQLNGWEKFGASAYGDYFPPQEGWNAFDAMVQSLRPGKLWLFPSALLLDTATDLYKSGTMSSSAMLDQQGNPQTTPVNGSNTGPNVFMDFSTDPWRQFMVGAYQTLASHGADLIQLDSSMVFGPVGCYNPAHQHPPGSGGNWQTLAWIDITQRITAAVAAVNPNAAVSAEEPAEVYLPYFSLYWGSGVDQLETNPASQEPVPLFQYVYHDSILFLGGGLGGSVLDGSFFRLGVARGLTWGDYQIFRFPGNLNAAAQAYLQSAIAAQTTYARKFVVDGVMLPAPQLSAPTTPVTWITNFATNAQGTGQFPSIQEGAWRATDGTVGIILTNIAPSSVTFSLPISYSHLGLPPGAAYTVQSTGGSAATTLDANLVKDSAYSITLTSQQILLVTLTPKATPPQIFPAGVVLHSSTSTTVSPGTIIDIYGSNFPVAETSAPQDSPRLPAILGNVQVLVNGIPAPLLYVGPAVIIAQVPGSVLPGTASVVVSRDGAASAAANITVQPAAPSILTYGTKRATVQNPDYSLNSSTNGAKAGDNVLAYLVGSGPVAPALADGVPAPNPSSDSPLSRETLDTVVTVGGLSANVTFAGMVPGLVGLVVVTFQVPDLPPGDYPIQVSIGTYQSNSPVITVAP